MSHHKKHDEDEPVHEAASAIEFTKDDVSTRISPLGDRVVVMEFGGETIRASGLLIPEAAVQKTHRGIVVAVGPGPRSPFTGEIADMGLRKGDEVMFSSFTGTEVEIGGIPVVVLREPDIICVIEEGPAEAAGA